MTGGPPATEPASAELLDIAVTAARQAGEFLLGGRSVDLVIDLRLMVELKFGSIWAMRRA